MQDLPLCNVSDIDEPGTKGFSIDLPGYTKKQDIFVVRNQGNIYVYKNQCPHTLINLNWQPDQFLNYDEKYIQCAMHGALFQIHDGFCLWGPCQGQSLNMLKSKIENEKLILLV